MLIIYYSGFGCNVSDPEICLGDKANVMLTFADSQKKPHRRFLALHKARENGKGNPALSKKGKKTSTGVRGMDRTE
jgi:hypothetical protein